MKIINFPTMTSKDPQAATTQPRHTGDLAWLRDIKNDIKANYRQMYNSRNPRYASLWEQYVSINPLLIEQGLPPIDIPDEMDFPFREDYFIKHLTENYTQWYKRENKQFCEMMVKTIAVIEEYLGLHNTVMEP